MTTRITVDSTTRSVRFHFPSGDVFVVSAHLSKAELVTALEGQPNERIGIQFKEDGSIKTSIVP